MEQLRQEMRQKKKKVDFKEAWGLSGGPLVRNPSANVGDTVGAGLGGPTYCRTTTVEPMHNC